MNSLTKLSYLGLILLLGCAPVADQRPVGTPSATPSAGSCDVKQAGILHEADLRAAPWSLQQHLDKNFADHKIAWLMPDAIFQKFIVKTAAKNFGRCSDNICYLFAAPAAVIHKAVTDSMVDGKHDPAVLGKALGLPATNFEGPLRMMTLDVNALGVCVRLPVDSDPGVWKCKSAEDKDCFKFGGYTSGGVPEVMAINAPVEQTQVEVVP